MFLAVNRDRFEELVREALLELPPEIAARMNNVDVEVQDWPSPAILAATRLPRGHMLLGLYQGVPLTRRSSGYNLVPPDRILIFQRPLERISRGDDDLRARVRDTVVHEIAHHFGISDARLREIEAERRAR
jgi:predicted Zn-dependent protease with MMP-like domain